MDPILAADDDYIDFLLCHCEFNYWPNRNFYRIESGVTLLCFLVVKNKAFSVHQFGKISILNNVKLVRIEFWLSKATQHTSQRWD
jgi:hypothetical protein